MDKNTLIYILFIVVSIIASIAKNSAKKKNKKSIIPNNLTDEFSEFEEEQPYDPFEQPGNNFTPTIKVQDKSSKAYRYDDSYEDNPPAAQEKVEPKISIPSKTSVENFQEEESEFADFEFDPVKAVIYTEILKRPEY